MITKNFLTGKCYRNGVEITEEEYTRISALMRDRPKAPEGYAYRFTEDETWELYEVPVVDKESDMSETELKAMAYDIITGVAE